MRRSSIVMLAVAFVLGLVAVFLARGFLKDEGQSGEGGKVAVRTVPAVVAAADINFGEKITIDKLKVVDWPSDTLPQGTFQRVDELTTGEGRTAMRPIVANEVLTQTALAVGANRLSTAPLLAANMRAVSVPVNEVAGVAGLIYPGDRVDVFFTRQPDEAMPYGELLAQGVRVLAVGVDMNVGKDKPEIVKSATLEVSPLQAQKIALAMATGQINLALRHFSDESRVRLQTVQVMDLNDGTVTRLVRKPAAAGGASVGPQDQSGGGPASVRRAPLGNGIAVMRGTETTIMPVIGR